MITLEMIDQIVERTGVTYAEAKQALEENDEDVIKAIISIEENSNGFADKLKEDINIKKDDLINTLKEIIAKGNATKIIVEKNGEQYLSIPLTFAAPVGAASLILGTTLIPVIAVLGVGVYVGNFTVKVIKKDGSEVNVNKETQKKLYKIKHEAKQAAKKAKDKMKDEPDEIIEITKEEVEIIDENDENNNENDENIDK